jgi:23S rRNA pseudouridine1911/1915/1917 synthase
VPILSFAVTVSEAGKRLDTVIIAHLSTLSRSRANRLIRGGHVTVNGLIRKPGYLTKTGDIVRFETPSPEPITCSAEPIPLSILYEDGDVIVLNKPPGLVVHPGAGHKSRTLVNALLFHCPDLKRVGGGFRPGIVHRLDKDTSGILVVAKNDKAHESLSRQFKKRQVQKRYLALVYGNVKAPAGVVSLPIGRHPTDRKKMSTESRRSRSTETLWKIKEAFSGVTLLEIDLKTGRTHQVRVHCAAIGHPVVGDATYGWEKRWKDLAQRPMQDLTRAIRRQMLHAWKLSFVHPRTGQWMHFESPVPKDMASVLESLRSLRSEAGS